MKLETQRDRWQAVLDGREVVDIYGRRVKLIDGYLHTLYKKAWEKTHIDFLEDIAGWQLYEPPNEPPKPENKVIVIKEANAMNGYEFDNEIFDTENDAIRAAMEWIGEKAQKVKITPPEWFVLEDETYYSRLGRWGAIELKGIELALLMRWPIEVLEEV